MQRIGIIDSHTGGEPTRTVITGAPDLGNGSIAERLCRLRDEHDWLRKATVLEPRGSDVVVGALLLPPSDPACAAAAIFFNNVGYLGMCGHGTIGLVATLAHLGRIGIGPCGIETPVGSVTATLHGDGRVSVANVPSYRKAHRVEIDVAGLGRITGDVAWGGNWFFLTEGHGETLELSRAKQLTAAALRVRAAVNEQGFPEVDHVEFFGPPRSVGADSRSFVLCPGGEYDRSPCGTGTSAKLACLAADGKLAEGARWVQESIIGSTFEARYRWADQARGIIDPSIIGQAFITAESALLLDPSDPFRFGIA